jgi:hypothetical protein
MRASLDSALRDTLRASFAMRKSRLESLSLTRDMSVVGNK